MKMMQKSMLALAVLATTAMSVQAADVKVKVIGKIVPGTCTPTLGGGGTIDFGSMSPNSLDATDYTKLASRDVDFSIACTAATKVAIKATSNRLNTLAGSNENASGSGTSPVDLFGVSGIGAMGLGTDGTAKIGGYTIRIMNANLTADNNAVYGIFNNGSSWNAGVNGQNLIDSSFQRQLSWAGSNNSLAPVAFQNLNGKLAVEAYINKRSALDLTKEINLDGEATIELVYLP